MANRIMGSKIDISDLIGSLLCGIVSLHVLEKLLRILLSLHSGLHAVVAHLKAG